MVAFINKLAKATLLLCFWNLSYAATDELSVVDQEDSDSPPSVGNFALPSPQQPGPLMSFGQTLIGQKYIQLSLNTFSPYSASAGGAFNTVNASAVYGLSDNTAFYFSYPIQDDIQTRTHRKAGLLDASVQLEHAVYSAGNNHYQEQATVLGAVTIPLNHESALLVKKRDEERRAIMRRGGTTEEITRAVSRTKLDYGSPTFFAGATYNRTYADWLGFVSPGFLITTPINQIQLGSQWYYQAGIGRNIYSISNESILFALVELDGQYTEKDYMYDRYNPNSGGNVIDITPSIWFSMRHFIAQVGVGFPIVQNLYGNQTKTNYYIATNISWTIN